MKVCLVASPGGHLTQLLYLERGIGVPVFFITYADERTASLRKAHLLPNIWKRPLSVITMVPRIAVILLTERPQLVISTGAEIAVPTFVLARILGIDTMFIESIARSKSSSVTGRLVYPLSKSFLVQWPSLLHLYGKKAQLGGSLL